MNKEINEWLTKEWNESIEQKPNEFWGIKMNLLNLKENT